MSSRPSEAPQRHFIFSAAGSEQLQKMLVEETTKCKV